MHKSNHDDTLDRMMFGLTRHYIHIHKSLYFYWIFNILHIVSFHDKQMIIFHSTHYVIFLRRTFDVVSHDYNFFFLKSFTEVF